MALPDAAFALGARVAVKVGKTPCVSFDTNDCSVPHTPVQRTRAVLADEQWVRVLDGTAELARHRRCWDSHAQIEDDAQVQRLVDAQRGGQAHRACDRLAAARMAGAARARHPSATRRCAPMTCAPMTASRRSKPTNNPTNNPTTPRIQRRAPMNGLATPTALREQAAALRLHGLIEHWAEVMAQPGQARWVAQMPTWEAAERSRRRTHDA